MSKISGIYAIHHTPSGRRYIGSSLDVRGRLLNHRRSLVAGTHTSPDLQRAWDLDGPQAFRFALIKRCLPEALAIEEQLMLSDTPHTFNSLKAAARAGSRTAKLRWFEEWKSNVHLPPLSAHDLARLERVHADQYKGTLLVTGVALVSSGVAWLMDAQPMVQGTMGVWIGGMLCRLHWVRNEGLKSLQASEQRRRLSQTMRHMRRRLAL